MIFEVLKYLAATIFGVVATVIGGIYLYNHNKPREIVRYELTSFPLISYNPKKEKLLKLLIERNLVEQQGGDDYIEIENANVFLITVKNIGNIGIEKPILSASFENDVKIINVGLTPSTFGGENIKVMNEETTFNGLKFCFPFIRIGQEVVIRIITTGNQKGTCELDISGMNTELVEYSIESEVQKNSLFMRKVINYMLICYATLTFIILGQFLLPNEAKLFLGWSISKDLQPPKLDIIILIPFIFLALAVSTYSIIIRRRMQSKLRS